MNLSTVSLFKNLDTASDKLIHIEGETLKKYQSILIQMTEDIVDVCEENQVVYHLTGGSALGAIRHKGFIPWDDDMDIDILGSDFERFVEAFQGKYGEKYWIHTYHTPGHGMLANRVRLKNSICRAREDVNNEECGFYVDLFRIENTYDSKILRIIHGFFCMGFGFLLSCRNFYKNRDLMMELSEGNAEITRTFRLKINLGRLLSFLSVTRWAELTQWVYGLCKNNCSKYVTVPAGRKHYFGEMRLRENFVETTDCTFEGHKWKIPKDYDGYLRSMYGNYMEIPAEEDREKHILLELKFPEAIDS
ncbi:MAG: LicD family protein [Clostridiales bacterium]|nr:LicD family protein [Clostridiales bacterium]